MDLHKLIEASVPPVYDDSLDVTCLTSNETLAEAVNKRLEAERQLEEDEKVDTIVSIFKTSKTVKGNLVSEVRKHRRLAKLRIDQLNRIEKCTSYSKETGNYLPLALELSMTSVNELLTEGVSKGDMVIPSSWKPTKSEDSE